MGRDTSLDSRLKMIRKELALIDKDLKALSDAAGSSSASVAKPRIRSREFREKREAGVSSARREIAGQESHPKAPRPEVKRRAENPASRLELSKDNDERFLEYLSSSFNTGRPLGKERQLQRNKAILMLIIVLFILFFVLYSVFK